MTNEQNEFFNVEHLSKSTRVSAPTVSFSWRARAYTPAYPGGKKRKKKRSLEKLMRFSVKSGSIVAIFQPSPAPAACAHYAYVNRDV